MKAILIKALDNKPGSSGDMLSRIYDSICSKLLDDFNINFNKNKYVKIKISDYEEKELSEFQIKYLIGFFDGISAGLNIKLNIELK